MNVRTAELDDGVEVDKLWRRWKQRAEPEALEALVIHYAPLVKFVAGRVGAGLPPSVDRDDLVSDGLIGLMEALDRFDLSRGLQFQTFAVPRIRGAIVDGLRAADWVPRSARDKFRVYDRAVQELEQVLGRSPTVAEIAARLKAEPDQVTRVASDQARSRPSMSLDETGEARSTFAVADVVGAEERLPVDFVEALRRLPPRQQVLVALYYWERLSLAQIGRVLGVTESRVSQLHKQATQLLREALGG
jgi:RNA polymerase sigma factor for flagellar operon FliA